MARVDLLVPFILKWETGNKIKSNETLEQFFDRCNRSKGAVSDDPDDTGGFTVCGITYETYRSYCKVCKKPDPSKEQMRKDMTYEVWRDVLKRRFWDKCSGDAIRSQSLANIVVDWFWMNGFAGIKELQRSLMLTADGLIGPKTLSTLNGANARNLFEHIKRKREEFYNALVEKRPANKKFIKGWLNRLSGIQFKD